MTRRKAAVAVPNVRKPTREVQGDGLVLLVEASHAIPLVDLEIVLRTGTVQDPEGREGLTRLTWRTLRMGTRALKTAEVEETIARLGARLSFDVGSSFVRIHGTVIKRSLVPFMELVAKLLREPAFRAADVAHAKRETLSDLVAITDDDRALAGRWLRRTAYAGHPYGRPVLGRADTLRRIRPADLRAHWEKHFVAPNAIVALAGDVSLDEARRLVDAAFGGMRGAAAPPDGTPEPSMPRGRRVVVIDKPDRTQTQIYVGTLGIAAGDARYFPVAVANGAFGGSFTSVMMQEIREKRGWSYGAFSRFGVDRRRELFTMWAHPASGDAAACVALELDLLERFVERGVNAKQHAAARSHIANGHCFDVDTAVKRLEPSVDTELLGLPEDFHDDFEGKVRAVTRDAGHRAVKEVVSTDDLVIAVTATASDVVPALERLPGVKSLEVVPFDRE